MMDMQVWRDARARAEAAAEAIRNALAGLELPERDWGSIRPVVSVSGRSYVHVGVVRADAVERVADALRAAAPQPRIPAESVEMRWLDTGSGPGVMVPVIAEKPAARPTGDEPG
ncbi:hypothetical protein ACWEFL_34495 [Streptomyces sp. NPDC004838]